MEKRQHLNEEAELAGEMSVQFDIASGRIACVGAGFWSLRQTTAFFEDWLDIVHRIHATGRPVSAMVDMSAGHVQKAEVADLITHATAGLYTEGDAIAMLVPTSLAKMQMRRVLDPRFHEFFISRNAAETWLAGRAMAIVPHRHLDGTPA